MKKIVLVLISLVMGIIISFSIYMYYVKINIDSLDIYDCKIQYATYDYKVEYSTTGYTLTPKTFGAQYIFLNYFSAFDINRKEFLEEDIIKKDFNLQKSIVTNKLEIYKGFHHSENNFTLDTTQYYILGKTFYIRYINHDEHIQRIIDSCSSTWKKVKEKKRLSPYVLKNFQEKLGVTREEAIEHFEKIGYFLDLNFGGH